MSNFVNVWAELCDMGYQGAADTLTVVFLQRFSRGNILMNQQQKEIV